MAATPNKPNIQYEPGRYNPGGLKPGKVIDNPPTPSLSKTLAQNKAQIDATK